MDEKEKNKEKRKRGKRKKKQEGQIEFLGFVASAALNPSMKQKNNKTTCFFMSEKTPVTAYIFTHWLTL